MRLEDPRLAGSDQPVRRGPGFVWELAAKSGGRYFLSLDDDVWLRPAQVATLFEYLRNEPGVPHGIAGEAAGQYVQNREVEVETLFLAYATTREHVEKYLETCSRLTRECGVPSEDIEMWADDLVMSRCGSGKARIHDVGFFLQGRTCYKRGVALHRQPEFEVKRRRVEMGLAKLRGN